jgi:hypothetical protein
VDSDKADGQRVQSRSGSIAGFNASALSPQLVTCKGQAIWYVDGVDTICSRYRVSKMPDQVSGFFVVPELLHRIHVLA